MKLRFWLRRIKGLNVKGLHCRRSKPFLASKPITAKPTFLIPKSPVFASGNLSLPCLSPALSHKAPHHIVNQSMLSLSPLSPSPSPALTTTPTGHNTPLALKDLLGFEAVDRHKRPPPPLPSTFACIAASLGCCQTQSPRVDDTHIKQFADYGKQNCSNTSKLRVDHGRLQESTTKWTGMCKCMLVRVEKQSMKTHADVHSRPRRTHGVSTGNSHRKYRHSMQNGCAHRAISAQAMDSSAYIDIEHAPSLSRSADVCKKPSRTSSLDRRKTLAEKYASLSMERNGRRGHSVKKPPNRYTSSPKKERLSALAAEADKAEQNLFAAKAGPSVRPSLAKTDKLCNRGDIHDAKNAHAGEPLVHKWTSHQEQENRSGGLADNLADQAVDGSKLSGLGSDEESSLLQLADSYDSSETFSISSHSPWLNEPMRFIASSSGPVDLEAHARPWIATESFVSISKSAFNQEKSRGGDAKASRRSYKKAFAQRAGSPSTHCSKTNTIVLPSEIGNANLSSSAHACNAVNGGVKGGLAVEKRSRDPYVDFTDSMLDMILQNHICSSKELEGLLQCFLSLNSLEHHDVIVQAFTEVWEKVVVGRSA